MKTKTLLVFHGSANKEAISKVAIFTERLRKLSNPKTDFSICYLKTPEPQLSKMLIEIAKEEYNQIRLLPVFFLPGTHMIQDIPLIVKNFSDENPDISVTIDDCLINEDGFAKYISGRL